MSVSDDRRALLDAPDGTSSPMPLIPIARALETLHRKADFIISMCSFMLGTMVAALVYAVFRPDSVLVGSLCGAAGGLVWYLAERHAHKI